MTSGQRKRSKIHQHPLQHHKKRHTSSAPHHHHRQHHQQHSLALLPPIATATTNLYHDSPPHNYLVGTTAKSLSSLVPQNPVFQTTHTKKKPSSSPLNLHDSGQLLNIEEDVFAATQADAGDETVVTVDTDAMDPMTIPSYVTKNFALFPQPTTTYETEIITNNSEGLHVASGVLDGLKDIEEDNEITSPVGRTRAKENLAEQVANYHRHKPPSSSPSSSSLAKTIKNEQLLQQFLQQQQKDQPEILKAAAFKSAKNRGKKNKAGKDYNSEDDMTEAMMYSSPVMDTKQNPAQSHNQPAGNMAYSGSIKTLTVDDIWSQLQQQYLNQYTPRAQPSTAAEGGEQLITALPTAPTKTKQKRKRNTKRQRYARPATITSHSTSWPAKPLSFARPPFQSVNQHQPQYYDAIRSLPSASAFSDGSGLPSYRDTDYAVKRPFNKINVATDEDDSGEENEDGAAEFGEAGENDDFDVYGDDSFEDSIYQRGKKISGRTAPRQNTHTNNPFSTRDLYGSFSTPVTATMATNVQPSKYHPNLVSSTSPSFASATVNSFLPAISHPSTSYQWRTQDTYPVSYQTYLLQHQQEQQPQWTPGDQFAPQQPSALNLPKATIIQTPNSTPSSSSSYSPQSADQPSAHYKKRKNRVKPKRNRIVVI